MAYSMTVKLSPEQLEERRRQLDRAGLQAWLSPIAAVLSIYIYRRFLSDSLSKSLSQTSPQSSKHETRSELKLLFRRASWLLSTTHVTEFGPLYIQIIGLLYAAWLFHLTSRATGDDYMHITKAFGHVAISQLPFHYLLSIKSPSFNPIIWATGLTHERLNAVHRLFGRIVHLWLGVHAVLYLRFFIAMGVLAKRVQNRVVILGILAFWSFNFLGLLALPVVRRRMYHLLFYQSHMVLSTAVIPILWFHVPYTRWLIAQVAVIYVLGGIARFGATRKVQGLKCRSIDETDLVEVSFTIDKPEALTRAVPGQHVYIIGTRKGASRTKTPFTIAHAEETENSTTNVSLVLRNLGGPATASLGGLSKGALPHIQIEGPYGEASEYMPSFLDPSAKSKGPILLVAGGIGVTYTLPIYLSLLSSVTNRGRKIKFVWLVKSVAEVKWLAQLLLAPVRDHKIDVEIFVTGANSPKLKNLNGRSAFSDFLRTKGVQIHDLRRRPNLKECVDEVFTGSTDDGSSPVNGARKNQASGTEVSVFVCGPSSLSRDMRKLVGKWVWREGRKVRWFEEVFGFGGS